VIRRSKIHQYSNIRLKVNGSKKILRLLIIADLKEIRCFEEHPVKRVMKCLHSCIKLAARYQQSTLPKKTLGLEAIKPLQEKSTQFEVS
jgi:hypothetical protein